MNKIVGGKGYRKTFELRNRIIKRIYELQKIGYERKLFYTVAEIEELEKLSTNDLNITEQYVLNNKWGETNEEIIN